MITISNKEDKLLLKDIPHGETFHKKGEKNLFLKLKTVNFINNSTIITDMIYRGDCLVANLVSGTCFIMKGDTEVVTVDLDISIKEKKKEKNNE